MRNLSCCDDRKANTALVFFLRHEQPESVRQQTLREVFCVVKPGGKVVTVDYARRTGGSGSGST
jgi:predicted methyltransferase